MHSLFESDQAKTEMQFLQPLTNRPININVEIKEG